MATAVEIPKLGNTVEDCLLVAWLKQKGDAVTTGDALAEIETDKTSFELTAPSDGVLLGTFFEAGALVPVFTVICAIGSPGEDVTDLAPHDASAGAPTRLEPGEPLREQSLKASALPAPSAGRQEPWAPAAASAHGAAPSGNGPLSPRAKRFASEHGINPALAGGSGPGGRVLEEDLRRLYLTAQFAGAEDGPGGVQPSGAGAAAPSPSTTTVRMTPVRERIARRLRESLAQTAQYTLNSSANAGGLLAVRKKMKAAAVTADVTIGDLVAYCTLKALLEVPDLNAELIDGVVHRHSEVNLGFACDTERGLVVPVVHRSEGLSLLELSNRMKELAARANQGSIAVDDLNGATFTISNLGSLGIESFTPVVNPPQVAILGVGALQLKAVRKPDGNIEFIDSIGLSLTLDHQVVDGAPGARFLKVVRDKIEEAEPLCTT